MEVEEATPTVRFAAAAEPTVYFPRERQDQFPGGKKKGARLSGKAALPYPGHAKELQCVCA